MLLVTPPNNWSVDSGRMKTLSGISPKSMDWANEHVSEHDVADRTLKVINGHQHDRSLDSDSPSRYIFIRA